MNHLLTTGRVPFQNLKKKKKIKYCDSRRQVIFRVHICSTYTAKIQLQNSDQRIPWSALLIQLIKAISFIRFRTEVSTRSRVIIKNRSYY